MLMLAPKGTKRSEKTQISVKKRTKVMFLFVLSNQCWRFVHECYIDPPSTTPSVNQSCSNYKPDRLSLYLQLHFCAKVLKNRYLSNCHMKTIFYQVSLLKQSLKESNVITMCFNHQTSSFQLKSSPLLPRKHVSLHSLLQFVPKTLNSVHFLSWSHWKSTCKWGDLFIVSPAS